MSGGHDISRFGYMSVAVKPGWKVVDLEGEILERRHPCGLLDREPATHSAIIGPRTPEQLDSYIGSESGPR